MPRVFVTGGNGFIGRHLVQLLTQEGFEVVVYSRQPLVEDTLNVRFISGDVLDFGSLAESMRGCDTVVHLAAFVSKTGVDPPLRKLVEINVLGSLNVFRACVLNNVEKVVNLSTAAIYADGSENVVEEDCILPKCSYGISKLVVENYARLIAGLKFVHVRTPLVYGSLDMSNRVLNKLVSNCNSLKPLLLFKGGDQQILDYIHVHDLCSFIMYALRNAEVDLKVFNISGGEPVKVGDLAHILSKIYKDEFAQNVAVVVEDVRCGEFSRVIPTLKRTHVEVKGCSLSIQRALSTTAWKPKYTLYSGLLDYISSTRKI